MKTLASAALLLLTLLCSVGVVSAAFNANAYDHSLVTGDMTFYWKSPTPTTGERELHFAVKAPTVTGWIGFGIGDDIAGSMPGADIGIATIDAVTGQMTVRDYYATDFTTPIPDCNNVSDWIGVGFTRDATSTVVEIRRKLNVTDAYEDRPILETLPTRLLFAHGSSMSLSYHGSARSLEFVNLFDRVSKIDAIKVRSTTKILRLPMNNYTIPQQVTTYEYSPCQPVPPNINGQEPWLIGFDMFLTAATKKYVHHIVLKGWAQDGCSGGRIGNSEDIWVVSSKESTFAFPDGVGMKMTDYKSFNFEMHYDNPNLDGGQVDDSGVEILYTYEPQQQNAGILQVGDPLVLTPGAIPKGYSTFEYSCPGSCTSRWTQPVTVFADALHMHQIGAAMQLDRVAADGTVQHTDFAEYFAFHQQQTRAVNTYTINPGDKLVSRCSFHRSSNTDVVFGQGSSDEMCIGFLYYYPKAAISNKYCGLIMCGALDSVDSYGSDVLPLKRQFGLACDQRAPPTPVPLTASASQLSTWLCLVALAVVLMA